MPKAWTPQGTADIGHSAEETIRDSVARIRRAITSEHFATNIDAQAELIHFVKTYAHLGHTDVNALYGEFARAVPRLSFDRIRTIAFLEDPNQIRDALKRVYHDPRPPDPAEELYAVPGWLGSYMAYARESNSPSAYHFWLGATVLGACLRRNLYLPIDSYKLYGNQYLFVVGQTALGKGISFGFGEPLVSDANRFLCEYVSKHYEVAEPGGTIPSRIVLPLNKDTTPEHMVQSLQPQGLDVPLPVNPNNPNGPAALKGEDSVGILFNEELVSIAGKHRHGTATLFHMWTALWTCPDVWSRGTRGFGHETLIRPTLTLALASTLEWINRSVSDDMFEGGFMSRAMWIYRTELGFPAFKGMAPPPDPVLRISLARQLVPWMLLNPARPVEFTDGALKLWSHIREEQRYQQRNCPDLKMRTYFDRKQAHIGKMALAILASKLTDLPPDEFDVTHLERYPSFRLDEATLDWAKRIVEHEEVHIPECFEKIGEHRESAQLEQYVERIRRLVRANNRPVAYNRAMDMARRMWGSDAHRMFNQTLATRALVTGQHRKVKNGGTKGRLVWPAGWDPTPDPEEIAPLEDDDLEGLFAPEETVAEEEAVDSDAEPLGLQ